MSKIIAFLVSLTTAFSLFFGTGASPDYIKNADLKNSLYHLLNKDEILSMKFTGDVSTDKWSPEDKYTIEDNALLIKEKDKDFIILNLSDVHFTDYGQKALSVPDTITKIKKMVANVKPDLITVTGDIVCSDSTVFSVKLFTDIMESFGIPWAPVFGNHDDEGNCDLNYICDIMMTSSNCLLRKGDPELGIGNYIINIAEENADGTLSVSESIIMLFSHNYGNNDKQLQWYKWATDGINRLSGGKAEISIFCHIPLAEYQYAYDLAWDSENSTWREGFDAYGSLGEKVAYGRDAQGTPYQKDFFNLLKESGTTKYVFCGHDHLNNFSIVYDGIRLTYSMKVGRASGQNLIFDGGTEITVGSHGITNIKQKSLAFGPVITIENIVTN